MLVIICLLFSNFNAYSTSLIPQKNPVGIANCGVSCFMNSTLQTIFTMNQFVEFLKVHEKDYKSESISKGLINIINMYATSSQSLDIEIMHPFYNLIDTTFFGGGKRQEDATQFLNGIFYSVTDHDIQSPESKKIIDKIIDEMLLINHIRVNKQTTEETEIKEYILPIEVRNSIGKPYKTLEEAFFESSIYEEHPEGSEFDYSVTITPKGTYLIVSLKLFEFDRATQTQKKIKTDIVIDESIQLISGTYSLIAMVSHQGNTTRSGHYVAFVKRPSGWWLCNDSYEIKNMGSFEQLKQYRTTYDPYILIFARAKSIPATHSIATIDKKIIEAFSNDLTMMHQLILG